MAAKFLSVIFLAGSLLIALPGCQHAPSTANAADSKSENSPVSDVPTVMLIEREDPEMQAAIRQARRDVDDFLISLYQPKSNQSDFTVKAAFAEGDLIEHMWMVDVKFEQGVLVGKLANTPELVSGFDLGELYAVTPEEITDWYYYEEDEMVGGYTIKLLMNRP